MSYLLINSRQYYNYAGCIIEDPDTSRKRIFIDNIAFDIDTLNVRFGEYFHYQSTTDQFDYTAVYADYDNPRIMLNGKCCMAEMTYSGTRNGYSWRPGIMDPWFCSLDYDNIPGKSWWKTSDGYVVWNSYKGLSTNTGIADWWIGRDFTGPATYRSSNLGTHVNIFYEDPQYFNEFWAIKHDYNSCSIGKIRIAAIGPSWVGIRSVNKPIFFVGKQLTGNPLFVEVRIDSSQELDFYEMTTAGYASYKKTVTMPGFHNYHPTLPSNIRTDDSRTRRVFYMPSWLDNGSNARFGLGGPSYLADYKMDTKILQFVRVIHNPTNGSIEDQLCTIIWPAGQWSWDYIMYARMEPSYLDNMNATYYYKPHQFTVGNRKFVTLLWCDRRGNHYINETFWYYLYDKTNRWITFEIDANDDSILRYHSVYIWERQRHLPRYYIPLNESGNQLVVARGDTVETFTFDLDKGWYSHDRFEVGARSIGIDSTGRIYVGSAAHNNTTEFGNSGTGQYAMGGGYYKLWVYTPSKPTAVNISLAQKRYTYSGTPINSSLLISARDVTGQLVAKDVRLNISGGSLTFGDGTLNKTVTTWSTGTATVSVKIIGGGKPVISAILA